MESGQAAFVQTFLARQTRMLYDRQKEPPSLLREE